jgi:hypothetical protein
VRPASIRLRSGGRRALITSSGQPRGLRC